MTQEPSSSSRRSNPLRRPGGALAELRKLVGRAMPADIPRLRSRLKGIDRGLESGKDMTRALQAIRVDVDRSVETFERRQRSVPKVSYPPELPVSQRRDDLIDAIARNQVVIVCGETGSGKTTQLPKMCIELGRGIGARIGHTQPRRIAARAVASRVAEELGAPGIVGSKMRFDDRTDDRTLIKVMTDGVLLAETRSDPKLYQYDTIIIDEAHERSLNIDFLLGFLKRLLPKRPDLKVIVTSATIDAGRFAEHFETSRGPAPVLEISGRTFPVETRYQAPSPEWLPEESAAEAAVGLIHEGHSDVLVFMPGEREIRQTAHALRHHPMLPQQAEVVPLYARLSPQEQQKAFRPSGHPRVVVATNVAETSITVPNIRGVVDPGFARIKRYSARSKIDQLLIEPVSQASANQRSGRCGRVAPGVCVRLYEESDFDGRDAYTPPELLRSDLAGVILQMIDLNLGDPTDFPFIDAPVASRWRDGYDTLRELGAINEDQSLTQVGQRMGRLPVDPRIARMILAGHDGACLHDVLIIAAALSVQDPRVRPHEKRDAADQAHAEFREPGSDFLTLKKIWDFYHEEHKALSRRKLARLCEKRFLSPRRIDEWREVFRQLLRLCREMKLDTAVRESDPADVHRAILSGLLINVGRKGEQREYQGTRNTKFEIAPGSACTDPKPKWLMAGEIVRTHKTFARTVASVNPEWIERAAEHLVKRSYSDPRWDERTQRVIAEEKVLFEGLEIVPKRTVHYGPIDSVESRRIFIHHALVEGEMRSESKGMISNRKLERRLDTMQAKARRSDFIADSETKFAFYDKRIPHEIFTARSFERWAIKVERHEPDTLRMREEDLLIDEPEGLDTQSFPDRADVFGTRLKIQYALEPGEDQDGATVRLTPDELHKVTPEQAEWMIPGHVPLRVNALVRSLPRDIRRRFDLDQLASRVSGSVQPNAGAITHQLARLVSAEAGVAIRPDQFRLDVVPVYLRVRFEVVDGDGKELGSGRDLAELRRQFEPEARRVVRSASESHEKAGVTFETFEGLPESVELPGERGRTVVGFPALVLEGAQIASRVRATPWLAEQESRIGFGVLFGQALKRDAKIRVRRLPGFDRLVVYAGALGFSQQLEQLVLTRTAMALCVDDRPLARTPDEFRKRAEAAWNQAIPVTQDTIGVLSRTFAGVMSVRSRMDEGLPQPWQHAATDISQQMRLLTPDAWETGVPTRWLRCFSRYTNAIEIRLERLRTVGPARDLNETRAVYVWLERLVELAKAGAERSSAAQEFELLRWMLEEYRVSKFAQELGTSMKVSEKAMTSQYERVLSRLGTAGAIT
ncbi:MAG: ATP-dependent RNA helicase HrpA [Phycisphaerales bacterium]